MKTTKAITSTSPTTAAMTIPAIAPPDNPFEPLAGAADEVGAEVEVVAGDVEDAVGALVEKVMKGVIVGNTTPAHLCSAPEL